VRRGLLKRKTRLALIIIIINASGYARGSGGGRSPDASPPGELFFIQCISGPLPEGPVRGEAGKMFLTTGVVEIVLDNKKRVFSQ